MKNNKLSKIYSNLYQLNEELVNIERFTQSGNNYEVWDVEFVDGKIQNSEKKIIDDEQLEVGSSQDTKTLSDVHEIAKKYSTISPAELLYFYETTRNKAAQANEEFKFRIIPAGWQPEMYIEYLNKYFKPLCLGDNKSKSGKGIGELACHLAFDSLNWSNAVEPDVVINTGNPRPLNVSVKSFKTSTSSYGRGSVRTGESIDSNKVFVPYINEIKSRLGLNSAIDISPEVVYNSLMSIDDINSRKDAIDFVKTKTIELKKEIIGEHKTGFIFIWTGYEFTLLTSKQRRSGPFKLDQTLNDIGIILIKGSNNRITFTFNPAFSSDFPKRYPSAYVSESDLLSALNNSKFNSLNEEIKSELAAEFSVISFTKNDLKAFYKNKKDHLQTLFRNQDLFANEFIEIYNQINKSSFTPYSNNSDLRTFMDAFNKAEQDTLQNAGIQKITSSYIPKGKTLKEVYSNLYILKKKIIEGALGGHMMHPYEALDMTPDQLANRIKQYGVPQKLIEKVDGQNLFFTVSDDGTLLFARNKEDMTHEDLVEKFTGHPAEKPFIEGGNAIKSGVESLLRKVDHDEVIRLFHPSEGVRTFVNFEIMHPNKPNQIVYDEKYIVFHGIVDYRNGREEVNRSNQDQRIQELVSLMSDGVSSASFVLASNREVDLNNLTDVQISEYVNKIYEISSALGIESSETLGEGIINVIRNEINSVGVFLSDEALSIFSDYVIKGEDSEGRVIASKEWTKFLSKEDVVKLRNLGLTSAEKVRSKIGQILQPFKGLFVELGIDLLKGVKSSYMSDEMNSENILSIRDKLQTAITDLENYMSEVPEESWPNSIKRLIPHVELIRRKGLDNIVSSAVEGGVYNSNDNLLKVTGGFAPMNQIVGAAYRDRDNIFKTFKEKFMSQESSRKSLKSVFNLIF